MKLSVVSASLVAAAVLVLSVNADRDERQLFSSSRFSSSGLVFPGPPASQQLGPQSRQRPQQRPVEDQLAVEKSDAVPGSFGPGGRPQPSPQRLQQGPNFRAGNAPRPPFVPSQPGQRNVPERNLPPVPLSLIGQQPEEFIAAAQQRQQQQQQQQQLQQSRPQPPQSARAPAAEEEEEPLLSSAEIQDEFVPRAPARSQLRENPDKQPVRIRRPQEEQKPEPSIQQAVQQRRPNYPSDYKPSRPQQNNGLEDERRRPQGNNQPPADAGEEELLEEEEEEVKPDKLQLLLQKTDFSCADKKDGYYADEAVECEVFHYCQDRTRHSWLCPEGASFHQVHLICMPVAKDNICKKSSQFHFVNEYLYQPMQDEDGNNSTLYADRYYPEGYEPGVPFDMAEVTEPEKPNLQYNSRRPIPQQNRRPPLQQRYNPDRPNRDRTPINDSRRVQAAEQRRATPFQAPSASEEVVPFNKPAQFRPEEPSPNRRMSGRPQIPLEEEEEEDQQ